MEKNSVSETARYIFTSGKMIHDRVNRIVSNHMISCDNCGELRDLSVTQLHAIMNIKEHGQLSMSELAERMGVSPPSASAMVDRLVEKSLLIREHSSKDRRKVVVRISPEAIESSQEIENTLLEFFVGLVEKIGPETAQQWCDVLAKIKSVLD